MPRGTQSMRDFVRIPGGSLRVNTETSASPAEKIAAHSGVWKIARMHPFTSSSWACFRTMRPAAS